MVAKFLTVGAKVLDEVNGWLPLARRSARPLVTLSGVDNLRSRRGFF
jgi:hypothetical protein